jgi:hypothetical protein
MKRVFIVILSAALIAGPAQQAMAGSVAILQNASQQVAVQNQKGISRAVPGTALAYGDRIATGPEGNAVVSFPAGQCLGNHLVPPRTIATVSEKSCLDFVTGAKADLEWQTIAILAGLAIGGGVLAYELTRGSNHTRPASP